MGKPSTIKIDDVEYVRADSIKEEPLSGYSIIRADSGVFFGKVKTRKDREVEAEDVRQIWSFTASAGVNYLDIAASGVSSAKMTHTIASLVILDAREIAPCAESVARTIREWPVCNKK